MDTEILVFLEIYVVIQCQVNLDRVIYVSNFIGINVYVFPYN